MRGVLVSLRLRSKLTMFIARSPSYVESIYNVKILLDAGAGGQISAMADY
jgi:hypothetical protein